MTRTCKKCGTEKELNEINFRPHGHALGFRHTCRECAKKESADWSMANPGKKASAARMWVKNNLEQHASTKREWRRKNPRTAKSAVLRRTYGITLEDYERLLEKQNGGCAICGSETADSKGRRLHVDHCHTTGLVRGLLCKDCNTLIGYAKDHSDILLRASQYLLSV